MQLRLWFAVFFLFFPFFGTVMQVDPAGLMISCNQDYKEWWRMSQWGSVRMVIFTVSDWCPFCSKKSTIPSEFWYVIGFLCCLFSFLLHAGLGDVSSHVKISHMWWVHTPWILVHLWSFFGWMTSEWIFSLLRFKVYSSAGFTRFCGRVWGMEPAGTSNDFFCLFFVLVGMFFGSFLEFWRLWGVWTLKALIFTPLFDSTFTTYVFLCIMPQ